MRVLRFITALVLAVPSTAPTSPFVSLERRRSEFLFQTVVMLAATAGPVAFWWASDHLLSNGDAVEQAEAPPRRRLEGDAGHRLGGPPLPGG